MNQVSPNYFSIAKTLPISDLKVGARIHVIGVAGVAMAQLAIALADRGFAVSGSDKEFYDPMGTLLRQSKVTLFNGYRAENIASDCDLVLIGNAVSKDNVEVCACQDRNLRYTLFPQALYETVIAGKRSIVVSGTHGKTTTSAMLSYALQKLGLQPSYFVGGQMRDLESSLLVQEGKLAVVEGDEYDSAFFAKLAKFHFYRPDILVITALEYDHADIYSSLDAIVAEFEQLFEKMNKGATLIVNIDYPALSRFLHSPKWSNKFSIISFGRNRDYHYSLLSSQSTLLSQEVQVKGPSGKEVFTLKVPGEFNALNAIAALAVADSLQISREAFVAALAEFQGVKRRQEMRFDGGEKGIVVIEDFAHHPTAIAETIQAIKASYPGRKLVAIFEPRSNTARRAIFSAEYQRAFSAADEVILCQVTARPGEDEKTLLDVEALCKALLAPNRKARAFSNANAIGTYLKSELNPGDVVVIMSNGSFGGLIAELVKYLGCLA